MFGTCNWANRVWYFYKLALIGENLGVGFFGASSVVDAWIRSPGHCANLISSTMTELGVAAKVPHICQVRRLALS